MQGRVADCTTWRSVGASANGFFTESFIDELIHAAGLDPLKARIEMCKIPIYRKLLWKRSARWPTGRVRSATERAAAWPSSKSFGTAVAEIVEVTMTDAGIKIDKVWVAADVGKVVDPINFENQVQGGVVWGLGQRHELRTHLCQRRAVQQTNYNHHEAMRMYQCPVIEVRGLENDYTVRGIGEPPVRPQRRRSPMPSSRHRASASAEMPFNKFIDFV